ncbi:retrotransposon protein, putative, ty1-copia subclass [Tanacetum coccineum]
MKDFKGMSYDEIRKIFEKVWDFNHNFVPMDLEIEKEKKKLAEFQEIKEKKIKKDTSKKTTGKRKKYLPRRGTRSTTKKQKVEQDDEKEELTNYLDIVLRENVAVDVESLSTKYPIVDWKTYIIDAMNAEIQSMIDNMVWVLVDLPPGCKTVGSEWIFEKKTNMDGIVHTYKARFVAKDYTQLYGVDYEETFSPVADIRAVRILISIAAFYYYEIWQMDVKTAFLNGYLDEDIYMVFDEKIKKFGFDQNLNEPCVYQKASGSNVTFLILYVDDIIIIGSHIPSLQSVKDYLGKYFAMKDLGEAAFILGIKIYRDRYKMDNSKRGTIPMKERLDLNKSQGAQMPKEVNRMKNVPCASAVGSIMYVVRCTRPDVAFTQNITSRFQQNSGESH